MLETLLSVQTTTVPTKTTPMPEASLIHLHVREWCRQHLHSFDGHHPTEIYAKILAEIESPLIEAALHWSRQNQVKAAKLLAISRGTFRKKMNQYGLLKKRRRQQGNQTAT